MLFYLWKHPCTQKLSLTNQKENGEKNQIDSAWKKWPKIVFITTTRNLFRQTCRNMQTAALFLWAYTSISPSSHLQPQSMVQGPIDSDDHSHAPLEPHFSASPHSAVSNWSSLSCRDSFFDSLQTSSFTEKTTNAGWRCFRTPKP